MKTLNTLTAALLIVLSFSAFAYDDVKNEKLKMHYAVQTYIDAVSHGKTAELPIVLDDNAKLSINLGHKIINYNKASMVKSLKFVENCEQNCDTDYIVMAQTATEAVVKVTMKYEGFSKIDFINITNTKTGWRITNVSSSFI